jgi:putative ABC transport system permease protein
MISNYIRVVYASLKRKKLRSWLTLIGILIGIAAVISLITLGEGIRSAVTSQFDLLNPNVLSVRAEGIDQGPPGTGVNKPLKKHYTDDIEKINGVDTVIGRIIEDTQIKFNDRSQFTFMGSFPQGGDSKEIQKIINFEIAKGSMLEPSDTFKIVIGDDFTNSDKFGKPVKLRDTLEIEGKKFKVKGILKKKGSFIVDSTVMVNEDTVREIYDIEDDYDAIAVKIESGSDIDLVKERIKDYLRDERNVDEGDEDFVVETPEQALSSLNSTLFGVQLFIYLIAAISIIVGGIGIANTMYTSVIERTRDIGVMKAIGARKSQILSLFLIEAGMLGFFGGIMGVILGLSAASGLAYAGNQFIGEDTIKLAISYSTIFFTLLFSFIVGVISGIIPALKASKLKPVEALRFVE